MKETRERTRRIVRATVGGAFVIALVWLVVFGYSYYTAPAPLKASIGGFVTGYVVTLTLWEGASLPLVILIVAQPSRPIVSKKKEPAKQSASLIGGGGHH